jgi:predicted transposase YbfD/YdcC
MTKAVREGGGDYVIAIKGNQSKLADEANAALDAAAMRKTTRFHQTEDAAHGRHEVRRAFVTPFAQSPGKNALVDLVAVARVESWRTIGDKTSHQVCCYALSRTISAQQLLPTVRLHWAIENQLHWQLDLLLAEDLARSRKNNAPANLAILRRLVLNILRAEPQKNPAQPQTTQGPIERSRTPQPYDSCAIALPCKAGQSHMEIFDSNRAPGAPFGFRNCSSARRRIRNVRPSVEFEPYAIALPYRGRN